MSRASKFRKLYDPTTIVVETPPPLGKMFNEETVAAIKEEAYAQGYAEGKNEKELKLEIEKRKQLIEKEFLYNLSVELTKLSDAYKQAYENLIFQVKELSLVLFEKAFPSYANELCIEELYTLLETHLTALKYFGEIKVFVSQNNAEEFKEKLKKLSVDHSAQQIEVIGKDDLELMDCIIEWDKGFLKHTMTNIINEIKATSITPEKLLNTTTGK